MRLPVPLRSDGSRGLRGLGQNGGHRETGKNMGIPLSRLIIDCLSCPKRRCRFALRHGLTRIHTPATERPWPIIRRRWGDVCAQVRTDVHPPILSWMSAV